MAGDIDAARAREQPARRFTADEFRDVIGRFASGVTVITTLHDDVPYGTTASAMTSLALEPPMLLVCLSQQSNTLRAIDSARRFAVNILDEDQSDAAARFAGKGRSKFEGVPIERGEGGVPLLAHALATLECRVSNQMAAGTHVVLLAEVERGCARPGAPLAYFCGQFGRVELA